MSTVKQTYCVWRRIRSKLWELNSSHRRCLCSRQSHTTIRKSGQQHGNTNKQVGKKHKQQRTACHPVLEQFDLQYSRELGDLWTSARSVLLDPQSWQYGVMLNRFTAVTDVTQTLRSQGFSSLLPQADTSALLSDAASPVSASPNQTGTDSQLSHHFISQGSSEDSHPQSVNSSPVLRRDPQSTPSLSLSHPSLQCYIHPLPLRFPSQAHRPGQLKQYYLLNAASLLPVLALQVREGENVLDLCAAPGGKALAIMQCTNPEILCCNEPDPHRREWLIKTLESFLPMSLHSRVNVSAQDGRHFHSKAVLYDKVLVDAPCSNDRSWLYSHSSQQGEQRLKERARLPALQAQLLKSALSVVRPGGVVVYSTCTLSSYENYAVVERVLNDVPEAEAEDLWEEVAVPLSEYFSFGTAHSAGHGKTSPEPLLITPDGTVSSSPHRLGILVVPQSGRTWGPMFLSRLRRRDITANCPVTNGRTDSLSETVQLTHSHISTQE